MAGFVVSPNTIRVLLHWTLHGRPQLNVLHAQYTPAGPLNPNIAQQIFNASAAALTSDLYATVLAPTTVFAAVGVIDIRAPDIPEIKSTGTGVPGTSAGEAMPDAVSLVLTLRTGKTGRAHRGRIYTLGWGNVQINPDGTAPVTAADTAVTWHQAVQAAIAAQGAQLAVRSTAKPERPAKGGGTLPAKDYEITPVTLIEHRDLIFDNNRRRTDQLRR